MATAMFAPVDPPLPAPSPRGLLEVARILGRIREGTVALNPEILDLFDTIGSDRASALTAAALHDKFDPVYGVRKVSGAIDYLIESAAVLDVDYGDGLALTAATDLTPRGSTPDWVRGVAFEADACGSADVYDGCDGPDTTLPTNSGGVVNAKPTMVRVGARCSVMGDVSDRTRQKAVRLLNVWQHAAVAREFWRGDEAIQESTDTPYLADADALILATDAGAIEALSILEAAVTSGLEGSDCGAGQRAVIHASARTVTVWAAMGLLRVDGGLLLTALDSVVISGPGYDGSGTPGPQDAPSGPLNADASSDRHWAYGTGFPEVRLGPTVVRETMDVAQNDRIVWAERPALVTVAPCCKVAVSIDLTDRS